MIGLSGNFISFDFGLNYDYEIGKLFYPQSKELPFTTAGISLLLPTMTAIQYQNICMIAIAL